ncbi:FecR family protein [Flagellimonas flava]|uniref:FecR family protein n=1 Tax=Flagellimonas flava TaxID=570519 RepID=A0A1M5NQ45_9FLAO|nr:FecR family protein [Allomuricauda flava]SHG91073.1 FecR family protein [Allomuricauda flava]
MEFKLILKKLNNTLTKDEARIFQEWISESETHRAYFQKVKENHLKSPEAIDVRTGWKSVDSQLKSKKRTIMYWKYAAAAVLLVLLSLPFLFTKQEPITEPIVNVPTETIEIGSDKATLTLEDGTKVPLEKGKTFRTTALTSNGQQVVYSKPVADKTQTPTYNTLTIPRGGQFYIVLSDETKVWLNSDSELRYPVAFSPNQPRKVELVYGEAYFEVSPSTQNHGTHFLVATQEQEVDVLGTEFNIKAFKEDDFIETTLVNGKVAIRNGGNVNNLSPGFQSKLDKGSQQISIAPADIYNTISWKNGLFSFKNMALKDIMTVLSRWYDVEVEIRNTSVENISFHGVFNRNQDLENILSIIENTNEAKFTTKGKTIMVE